MSAPTAEEGRNRTMEIAEEEAAAELPAIFSQLSTFKFWWKFVKGPAAILVINLVVTSSLLWRNKYLYSRQFSHCSDDDYNGEEEEVIRHQQKGPCVS